MFLNCSLIFLLLFTIDGFSIKLTNYINPKINIIDIPNSRWFFIHSISNIGVTVFSIPDIIIILSDPFNLDEYSWSYYSYLTFQIAVMCHFYHIIFFKLTSDDILHHTLMILLACPIELYNKNILCSMTLFFLSGLPGALDYFLLYLVKINKFSKLYEKKIYLFLSSYIRSPGCCLCFYLSLNNLYNKKNYNLLENLILLLSSLLGFWNGQYLKSSCISFGKYIEKNKQIY